MRSLVALIVLLSIPCIAPNAYAQPGKVLDKKPVVVTDSILTMISRFQPSLVPTLRNINFYKIKYLSDGLAVTAYMAEPKQEGLYPCIISNRGGNLEFGKWDDFSAIFYLGRMASWGYIVTASQYRGNDGGEGKEEFGGKEINDVLNLVKVLENTPKADTSRIGIEGSSRGGMMTYLAMKKSCKFKAAVVTAGMANAFTNISKRPDMEKHVFAQLIPGYEKNKDNELRSRSAVFWADQFCKKTPLLIMHGSADWRVSPEESLELVNRLYASKHPTRFILFEGADHGIMEFVARKFTEMELFFETYLKNKGPLPDMEPHGR